jgi:cell division protein FtsL
MQAETLAALIQKQVIQKSSLDQLINDLSSEDKLANFLRTMGLS